MPDIKPSSLEQSINFILMKSGVTAPEIDACIEWAFGPGAWYVPIFPDWMKRWNKLHNEFKIKKSDSFTEFMFVVGFLFTQYSKQFQKLLEEDKEA